MNEKEILKAYQLSIRYLAPRARSVHEMRLYLEKKGFSQEAIDNTVIKLEKENLLNDKEFAAMFVEQRERFKPKSKFAIGYELRQKGIGVDTIESCVMDIDEYASALSAVKNKIKLWHSYDDDKFKNKIMNYLKNRGFSYEVSIATFNELLPEKYKF